MASNFFSRWSQRKLEGEQKQVEQSELSQPIEQSGEQGLESEQSQPESVPAQDPQSEVLGESGLEAEQGLESEQSEPSVASLLASEAESAVKKAALRKLFLSGEFSAVDGLNDYDHDYKAVKTLSSDVAEKLRDWMNSEEEQAQPESEEENIAQAETEAQQSDQPVEIATTESLECESEVEQVGQNIPHKQ